MGDRIFIIGIWRRGLSCGEIGGIIGFFLLIGVLVTLFQGVQRVIYPSWLMTEKREIVWAPDQQTLSATSGSDTAYVCQDGKQICIQPSGQPAFQLTYDYYGMYIKGISWGGSGIVLTLGGDNGLMLVPFSKQHYYNSTRFDHINQSVVGIPAFSPNGRYVAYCGGIISGFKPDIGVYVWDIYNPKNDGRYLTSQKECSRIGWTTDGKFVVFLGPKGQIYETPF